MKIHLVFVQKLKSFEMNLLLDDVFYLDKNNPKLDQVTNTACGQWF